LHKGERIVVTGLQRVRPNSIVDPTVVAMDRNVPESASEYTSTAH
jgi:hypothetical protein